MQLINNIGINTYILTVSIQAYC